MGVLDCSCWPLAWQNGHNLRRHVKHQQIAAAVTWVTWAMRVDHSGSPVESHKSVLQACQAMSLIASGLWHDTEGYSHSLWSSWYTLHSITPAALLQRRVPQTDGQSQHLPSQHVTITPARTAGGWIAIAATLWLWARLKSKRGGWGLTRCNACQEIHRGIGVEYWACIPIRRLAGRTIIFG